MSAATATTVRHAFSTTVEQCLASVNRRVLQALHAASWAHQDVCFKITVPEPCHDITKLPQITTAHGHVQEYEQKLWTACDSNRKVTARVAQSTIDAMRHRRHECLQAGVCLQHRAPCSAPSCRAAVCASCASKGVAKRDCMRPRRARQAYVNFSTSPVRIPDAWKLFERSLHRAFSSHRALAEASASCACERVAAEQMQPVCHHLQ